MTKIPEALRAQLSKAGKAGIKKLSREARVKGGKKSWETRLRKAREQEKEQQSTEEVAP